MVEGGEGNYWFIYGVFFVINLSGCLVFSIGLYDNEVCRGNAGFMP